MRINNLNSPSFTGDAVKAALSVGTALAAGSEAAGVAGAVGTALSAAGATAVAVATSPVTLGVAGVAGAVYLVKKVLED